MSVLQRACTRDGGAGVLGGQSMFVSFDGSSIGLPTDVIANFVGASGARP
jgi:hypothetical protein